MLALFFMFAYCVVAQPIIPNLEDKKSDRFYVGFLIREAFRLEEMRLKRQNANQLKLSQNKKNYELLYQETLKMLHLGIPRKKVIDYLSQKKIFNSGYEHPVQNPISKNLQDDSDEVPFSPKDQSSYSPWVSL